MAEQEYTGPVTTFSIYPFGPDGREFVINAQFSEQEVSLLREAWIIQEGLGDFATSSQHDPKYRELYITHGFRVPYLPVLKERSAGLQAIVEAHSQLNAFLENYPADENERNMRLFTELTHINGNLIILLRGAGILNDE